MKLVKQSFFLFLSIITLIIQSCTTLKPYEQIYVKDPEMQMDSDATKNFQNYVYSIREGAIPPSSTKSSGGCGCN